MPHRPTIGLSSLTRESRRREYKRQKDAKHYRKYRARELAKSKIRRAARYANPITRQADAESKKRWRAAHPEMMLEARRKWQRNHPENGRRASREFHHRKRAAQKFLQVIAVSNSITKNQITL